MQTQTSRADVAVIGAGIVGLATAWHLASERPGLNIIVLEKESRLAHHQTGRNSGVIHAGVYYKPGSLKALTCRTGKLALEQFCSEHGVAFERCGKVVVATEEAELGRLAELERRAAANGVECERIGPERLRELEPEAAGISALHVPETGIVDYVGVCETLGRLMRARGTSIRLGERVRAIEQRTDSVVIEASSGSFQVQHVVNCGGLYADRLARLAGSTPDVRIVPFRGEYYELNPSVRSMVRALIYPVPDPSFPFLGVHFTRLIGGGVECGPNAVLAFAREGYKKSNVHLGELVESLTYPGFLRLARQHWRHGMGEMWRSFSKRAFVKALSKLLPAIRPEHLQPAPSGVRAQALERSGALCDDFRIDHDARVTHVLNAPSPAATASLEIGRTIATSVLQRVPK